MVEGQAPVGVHIGGSGTLVLSGFRTARKHEAERISRLLRLGFAVAPKPATGLRRAAPATRQSTVASSSHIVVEGRAGLSKGVPQRASTRPAQPPNGQQARLG